MAVRAIRGATALQSDDADEMREAVVELLTELLESNGLDPESLVSVLFTATPDITSGFPATAARHAGLSDVPLMCAQELDVVGAPPLTIRVMVHANLDRPRTEIRHPYLRGTETLRSSLAP